MSDQESTSESASETDEFDDNEDEFQNSEYHFAHCVIPDEEGKHQEESSTSKVNLLYTLLGSSEEGLYPYYSIHNIYSDDWEESVTGWKDVAPNPKYHTQKKRQKHAESGKYKVANSAGKSIDNVKKKEHETQPVWKANVEPVTYRYVQNNGQYRLHKFCKEDRDWYTVRRKNAERVSPSLKTRYMQREIKRLMKRDFSRKSVPDESISEGNRTKRSQSTTSEGHRRTTTSPYSSLVKSASDLYIENISSRLDELDEEIKRDSQLRKSQDEQTRMFPFNLMKGKQNKKLSDVTARASHDTQSVQSAFIITPVGRQDALRPLEKITPQQRMKEDLVRFPEQTLNESGGGDMSENNSQPRKQSGNNSEADVDTLRILPLSETSNAYIGQIIKGKQENSGILGTSKLPLGRRIGGRFVSSVAVDDVNLSDVDSKALCDDRSAHHPRGRNVRDPNLPEISGRRLEVSVTNYRLL
ncbi:uncharacterized protein LOC124262436 [Haliotis rubra]|uniref:uncharacterized protein LOC124262436 n=1 Tax=Haliotis rubra TaxID=36100 RepID=UPI001EE52904|nr:uncharacterized protein LOC124262436 [Haliotis rubra]